MKIVRLLIEGDPTWAIAEGAEAYRLEGEVFGQARKGALLGPLDRLKLLAPVRPENKVVVLLSNWASKEGRDGPGFLVKPPNARINPGETIVYPELASEVWIETELGIVVGKRARKVSVAQAREHILGYTVSNDVTAAKWKKSTGFDVFTGKGFDTFCIVGPCIETDLDPTDTTLRGYIDGEQFFEKHSSHMLWDAYEVVSWLSQVMTLEAGDVISCGACAETLTRHMQPGQVVGVAIDGVGRFDNPVVAERDAAMA
jgi:2-keto-4-pentenoate hydratase/2-oxohepta-3-ene-1,7-dioic acid hydratase in catechol pathway